MATIPTIVGSNHWKFLDKKLASLYPLASQISLIEEGGGSGPCAYP